LIGEDLSSWLDDGGVATMGFVGWGFGVRRKDVIGIALVGGGVGFGSGLRRSLVLPGLVHVPLYHWNGARWMFAEQGGREAGEVGEIAFVEGRLESGERWGE